MAWLFPSVIATLVGTFLLVFLYFYLYFQDRNRYMLIWAVSWAVYLVRFLFMLAMVTGVNTPLMVIGNQMACLVSGVILLWGTYTFIEQPLPKVWVFASVLAGIWICASMALELEFMAMSLPTFFYLAGVNIYTGLIFIRAKKESRNERMITGVSFILWGVHKADYPFLRPIAWFAPWGYLLGAVLAFTVAIGMILLYFRRAKVRIQEGASLMRTLIESSPDLVWLKDLDGVYLACNLKFQRFFGADESEIRGRTDYDFMPRAQADAFRRHDRDAVSAGRPVTYEEEVAYADDGHRECLETIKAPLYDPEGRQIVGVLGVSRDITRRRQAEKDIQAIVETTVGHTGQGLFDAAVSTLCQWLGCECAILAEVLPDGRAKVISKILDNEYTDHSCYDLDGSPWDLVRANGFCVFPKGVCERFPRDRELSELGAVGYVGTCLLGNTGDPLGMLCAISRSGLAVPEHGEKVFSIIGTRLSAEMEREKALAALRESENRFNLAMQASRDGLFDWNLLTRDIYYSPGWKRMLGYGDHELPNDFSVWESLTDPSDVKRSWQMQKELVNQKRDRFEIEFKMKHKDGHWVDILSRARAVFDSGGRAVRIVGTHVDITDRKQMEKTLRQIQKMESIGNLAGGIAHDFNNILFPIMGMAELLMDDLPDNSPEWENAEQILTAGKRGSDLVKQILAFSRQTDHQMIPTRLERVLKEALRLCRASIPTDIEIVSDIPADSGMVMADASQMHQVAMNLITNAYHALGPAGGRICLSLKQVEIQDGEWENPGLAPGTYARIRVADTGEGIDPGVADKIFEPYFTTKEKGKGTGLGLAVVHGIIKDHGGEIQVVSETGKGSTFTVYLPVMAKNSGPAQAPVRSVLQRGRERILLVDDEAAVLRLETLMLERLGYQVTAYNSSMDALQGFCASPHAFDLVLSDMTMPNMTGDELAKKVLAARPDIPVIICTGFSERINQQTAEASGIKGFLMKPVITSELAGMIRQVLDEPPGSTHIDSGDK